MKFDVVEGGILPSFPGTWLRLTPETDAEFWQLRVIRQRLDRADMRSNLQVDSSDKPMSMLVCLTNEDSND